jgi:CubicO group peptidase (beta-lactamase class C family)
MALAGGVFFVAVAAALVYGDELIGIGTAYKAKMLCSEVFIAGRRPHEVLADLRIDDLKALRIIKTSVDEEAKEASASFFGIITRTAHYRGETGCALDFGGKSNRRSGGTAPTVSRHSSRDGGLSPLAESTTKIEPQLVAVLDEAFSEPDPAHRRRTRAVVVVHKGRVIAERYASGFGPDTAFPGWSMAKSVLNALVGILVRDGRLSVDTPLAVPEWHKPGDERASITLNQLLHMTSGLEFDENMGNPLCDVTRMLLAEPDMAAFAAGKKNQMPSGTRWYYSSGNSNIISGAIRGLMETDEYRHFPRKSLFEPLGMNSSVLETDASGTFVASSFMYANARDWARFGMLYLNGGVWGGDRILPDGWIEYTKTAATAATGKSYGAHFWLGVPEEYNRTHTPLPEDTMHAVGHEGQFVTIIPSYHTVIVRLGKTRYRQAWDHGAFIGSVLSILRASGGYGLGSKISPAANTVLKPTSGRYATFLG